jgi:hypothetical protein
LIVRAIFILFINRPKPRDLKLTEKITVERSCDLSFVEFKRKFRNSKSNKMAVDVEDLSDSGIEKACDDESSTRTDIVPNSPRVPPDGADNDDIQIDQLRPHNQEYHQQFSINIYPDSNNKCQQQKPQNGSNNNVNGANFMDTHVVVEDSNKISRLNSTTGPFTTQHEHHTSVPFSNNTYAAFKKGNVVRGILCPSLTNSFR